MHIILTIFITFVLANCGFKGELYLPESKRPAPVETPTPALFIPTTETIDHPAPYQTDPIQTPKNTTL